MAMTTTGHEVFAVNPHLQTFEGDCCYPDLQSIPGGVDGVVIITRPTTTQTLLVGNTIALVAAMTYDWTVNAIGPFELTEYLGLAFVYAALAMTARPSTRATLQLRV
jgi:CoA binding protein